MLLNMTKNLLSKVTAMTAAMLFYSIEIQALETCFSFIPYANNSSFVQLPENKKFCFHFSNEKTHMSTNELGGRILKKSFFAKRDNCLWRKPATGAGPIRRENEG
jgi:hypothetical protein